MSTFVNNLRGRSIDCNQACMIHILDWRSLLPGGTSLKSMDGSGNFKSLHGLGEGHHDIFGSHDESSCHRDIWLCIPAHANRYCWCTRCTSLESQILQKITWFHRSTSQSCNNWHPNSSELSPATFQPHTLHNFLDRLHLCFTVTTVIKRHVSRHVFGKNSLH